MPNDSLPCPFCQEQVVRNRLGNHLLSRKHQEAVRSLNTKAFPALQKQADYLLAPPKFPNWPDLPSITFSPGTSYYCCLGCKGCWVNQPYNHFATHKDCVPKHARALKALIDPTTVGGEERVKELETQIRELKAENAALKASGTTQGGGVSVKSEQLEELQSQVDDLEEENSNLGAFYRKARKLIVKLTGEDLATTITEATEQLENLFAKASAPAPAPPPPPPPPPAPEPKGAPLPAPQRDVEMTRPFQDPTITSMLGNGVKLISVTRPGKKVMPRASPA